jgi:hypothetical protein
MAEREEITGEIARENPKIKGKRSEKIEPKRSESITRREGMRGREGGGEGEGRGRRGGGGGERRTGGGEEGEEEGGERGAEESRGSRGRSRGKKGVNDGTLVRRGQADTMGVLVRGHDKVGAYVWMFVWMFGCLDVWMFGCLGVWTGGRQERWSLASRLSLSTLSPLILAIRRTNEVETTRSSSIYPHCSRLGAGGGRAEKKKTICPTLRTPLEGSIREKRDGKRDGKRMWG